MMTDKEIENLERIRKELYPNQKAIEKYSGGLKLRSEEELYHYLS